MEFARGVVARIEEGHLEGQHFFDDALGEVAADEDAHPLAVVVLRVGDDGREDFLAEQHRRDEDDDVHRPLSPFFACADEVVHFIDGPVEHDGVHLRHQRTD